MNTSLIQNPFFSGGLTLMAVGALMALLRNVPGALWRLLVHWLTISVEIPDRDPAFRWIQNWIVDQEQAGRARSLSVTTTWADADPDPTVTTDPEYHHTSGRLSAARFVLSPAPGITIPRAGYRQRGSF
jgi:chaperone BCS1